MALQSFLEKNSDADFLREMIDFTAVWLMAKDLPVPHRANAALSGSISATPAATK